MAITVYGTSPNMGEAEWSIYQGIALKGQWHEVVDNATDYAVAVGGGTRQITVQGGDMAVEGTLVRSDAPVNVSLAANGGANPRIDQVCLQVDWSGGVSTAGSLVVVQGTPNANPVPANLTRVRGTMWQVRLGYVQVDPGVGVIPGGKLEACVPKPRDPVVYKLTLDTSVVVHPADAEQQLARQVVDNPGWPYRIQLLGTVPFGSVSGGHTNIRGLVDDVLVTAGSAGALNGSDAVLRSEHTGNKTRASVAKLTALPAPGQVGNATVGGTAAGFTVVVWPN